MAPEMLTSKHATTKSDIWALGIIGYELCMLDVPFHGSDMFEMKKKIISGDAPSIPERQGGLILVYVLLCHCVCDL